jgi:glycosyltransferase involved in cell wall biosynthesis
VSEADAAVSRTIDRRQRARSQVSDITPTTQSSRRISVALCTYNGVRFLREQLDSIAAQTLVPFEIIVCDDGSVDGTVSIVETFAAAVDFDVRIELNDQNVGVTANYARAIALCSGEYIALADQDDVWLPDKLGRLAQVMDERGAAYAFCDARLIDGAGRDMGGKSLLARRFTLDSIRRAFATGDALRLLLKRDFIYGTTLMFRVDCRPTILPIPPSWSHDSWIATVLSCQGRLGVPVLEPLVLYRQHGEQASGGKSNPKRVDYETRAKACEDLAARLSGAGDGVRIDAIARVRDKERYLRAMAGLASSTVAERVRILAREVASGRWWRYWPHTFLVDKRIDPSALKMRLRR